MKVKDFIRTKVKDTVKNNPNEKNSNEHYYTEDPSGEIITSVIEYQVLHHKLKLTASSGVFGKRKVDKGTDLLISTLTNLNGKKVLDLGCGIGIVAISVAKIFPDSDVFASDINKRAVLLTRSNARSNKVRIKAFQSDGFEKINDSFDAILLNPPQSAGKDICLRLIEESYKHLNDKGIFLLVARKNKGGKSLSEHMESVYGNVKSISIQSGFHVYESKKVE